MPPCSKIVILTLCCQAYLECPMNVQLESDHLIVHVGREGV
jgi:hypothetical protein